MARRVLRGPVSEGRPIDEGEEPPGTGETFVIAELLEDRDGALDLFDDVLLTTLAFRCVMEVQ